MSTKGDHAGSAATDPALCRVGVKMPPFWPNKANLWFAQLDGQFALSNITSDVTKFYHVISLLDIKYAEEVEDIITKPPATEKYETIKKELLARLSASKENRVRQLLSKEEIGDRKPSQFLRHLRSLAEEDVSEDFLRTLWADRLPSFINAIIATQADTTLDKVAQLADHIMDASPHFMAPQVAAASTSNTLDNLCEKLETLTAKVESMSRSRGRGRPHYSSRSRSASKRRFHSRGRSPAHPLCWYHRKFGENAAKCRLPCSFKKNELSGR